MLLLQTTMDRYTDLPAKDLTTHSLNHVALQRPFDRHHLLTSFENWLKKKLFERRLRLESTDPLFFNWHCVGFLYMPCAP